MQNGSEQHRECALPDSIVIDTSPIPISITRAEDGRFLVVNAAWVELSGRQREDALGRTSLEMGYWPSAEDRRRWFELLRREGGLYGYETVLCNTRGEHRNILMSSSFIEFAGENCVISFIQDITERKQAENRLKETRDMMLAAVSAGQVYPWIWDLATDSLHWGVSPTQLLGPIPDGRDRYPDFRELVHPDDRKTFLAVGQLALDKGSQYYHEFRIVMTDGPVRWVAARGELMRDEAGKVVRMLGTTMDITQRKHDEERIHELAFFDQLTGLPNRTLLLDRMKQTMTANARHGSRAALLFIDLDNFKTLNDTFGHDMGDLLLKQVAQRLTDCVRAGDTVARLGGDEFIVILTGLGTLMNEAATQAETVGQKTLLALNRIFRLREVDYHSTPSIGATLFAGPQNDIEELLKQADSAMYRAKKAGRNTLRFFDPDGEMS